MCIRDSLSRAACLPFVHAYPSLTSPLLPVPLHRWAGNIWASTGCTSDVSGDYDHPTTETCVTNYCPSGGVCPDYSGPAGVTTKAEFALQEGGLDFYDVSVIDGSVRYIYDITISHNRVILTHETYFIPLQPEA